MFWDGDEMLVNIDEFCFAKNFIGFGPNLIFVEFSKSVNTPNCIEFGLNLTIHQGNVLDWKITPKCIWRAIKFAGF